RDEWSHFLPESITDLPLVARHTSPSEIIILYYLTIPFGIGSKLSELTRADPRLVISCNSFLARIDIISNNYP
ncbi:hypothetical protein, partial [Escherichia coli]|uniref:hypothetical protein n=1 Tax=Escherichia coli TaxID=562 RepID=UPI001CCC6987